MRAMTPDDLYAITWISDVAMHPDGDRVAFVASRMDRESDEYGSSIWVVDVAGGAPRQFTSGQRRDRSPRWSPDGRWLAFLSVRGEGDETQLFVMAADGGEAQPLSETDGSAPFGVDGIVWGPDSERIAFVAKTGERPDPDAKTKPHRRIDTLKYKMNSEGFTYDRRKHLFVVSREGDEALQLTDGAWDDGAPAWSPDGTQIAFTSARHAEAEFDVLNDLWTVPSGGGEAARLTATEGQYGLPSWSDDGERIACVFTAQYPGNRTLHVVEAATGERRAVDASFDRQTGGDGLTGEGAAPMWLPDGRLLCMAQQRGKAWPIIASLEGETEWLPQGSCIVGSMSLAADGATAAVAVSSQEKPAEVHLLDLEAGTMRSTDGDECRVVGRGRERFSGTRGGRSGGRGRTRHLADGAAGTRGWEELPHAAQRARGSVHAVRGRVLRRVPDLRSRRLRGGVLQPAREFRSVERFRPRP